MNCIFIRSGGMSAWAITRILSVRPAKEVR